MKVFRYAIVFMIVTLISCKSERKNVDKNVKIFNINFKKDFKNRKLIQLSSFVDSISYVKLESKNENLIGEISDIEFINNRFYILDKIQSSIFVFDLLGNFMSKIDNRGQGPKEYLYLTAFDVNSLDNSIHIYDGMKKKMIIYSEKGVFLRSFSVDDFVYDFSVFSKGTYVFYAPLFNMGNYRRGLWRVDDKGNFLQQLTSINRKFKYGGLYPKYFCRIKGDTIGLMSGEDVNHIYSITPTIIKTKYHIDVDIKIPKSLKNKSIIDFKKYAGQVYTKQNYMETENYLIFTVTNFKKGVGIFYDKKTSESVMVKDMKNDVDNVSLVGKLVGTTNGKWIFSHTAFAQTLKGKNLLITTENENPVLQIIHLK